MGVARVWTSGAGGLDASVEGEGSALMLEVGDGGRWVRRWVRRGRTDLEPFYSRRNPWKRLGCEARRRLGILFQELHVGCWVRLRFWALFVLRLVGQKLDNCITSFASDCVRHRVCIV